MEKVDKNKWMVLASAVKEMRCQHQRKHIVHLDFEFGKRLVELDVSINGFVVKTLYNALQDAGLYVLTILRPSNDHGFNWG
jgi:hypothetical protein